MATPRCSCSPREKTSSPGSSSKTPPSSRCGRRRPVADSLDMRRNRDLIGPVHFWIDSESRQTFIKTPERTYPLISYVQRTPLHSHTPYYLLRVTWSIFRPQLAAILQATILVGKTPVHSWIGTSRALQYLPPFFLPFTSSFFPQLLGIISNVINGLLQPLAARYSRWNGEGCLCKPSIKLTSTRVILYSTRLAHATSGSEQPSNGLFAYQQASLGEPPSLHRLNPLLHLGHRLWFHCVDTRLLQHVSMPRSRDDSSRQ